MKHNRGFSLAEIMVSVGLLGVISLGVMQVMKESSKLKKTSSQNVNVDAVVTKIQNLIRNPDVCKSTLFNLDPTDTSATGTNGFISKIISYPNIANVQVYKGTDPQNIDANDLSDFWAFLEELPIFNPGVTQWVLSLKLFHVPPARPKIAFC